LACADEATGLEETVEPWRAGIYDALAKKLGAQAGVDEQQGGDTGAETTSQQPQEAPHPLPVADSVVDAAPKEHGVSVKRGGAVTGASGALWLEDLIAVDSNELRAVSPQPSTYDSSVAVVVDDGLTQALDGIRLRSSSVSSIDGEEQARPVIVKAATYLCKCQGTSEDGRRNRRVIRLEVSSHGQSWKALATTMIESFD